MSHLEENSTVTRDHGPQTIDISVLIGRVSTEDSDRILETIDAFAVDNEDVSYEIVIVDRLQDALSARLASDYPEIVFIGCGKDTSLPEMRTIAFEASHGSIVAVTEDHCVPSAGWLRHIMNAFNTGGADVAAVGGPVDNGVTDSGLDWATFLCEYSFFFPPVAEGPTGILPGMNVAYRREVLLAANRSDLTQGFWETTLHGQLLSNGGKLISGNAILMHHCKKFSFGLFARQRYIYSRYFAGLRAANWSMPKRAAMACASMALPPLLLWRVLSASRRKGLLREFAVAFPSLAVLVFVWAFGESVGAIAGTGNALAQIE